MPKKKTNEYFKVKVPKELHDRVKATAKAKNISMRAVVDEAMDLFLSRGVEAVMADLADCLHQEVKTKSRKIQ